MLLYKLIFFIHITFRKIFKKDLRPSIIHFFYINNLHSNSDKSNEDLIQFKRLLKKSFDEYVNDMDKRKLWERHRLDFINNPEKSYNSKLELLKFWTLNTKNFNHIIFENMMESSLRAINILSFINEYNTRINASDRKLLNGFLRKTYVLNFLCPDMYFKRKKIKLIDESNNHFIFCILFQILYKQYINKLSKKNLKELLNYINKKFSNDGFLMEGSTSYTFSITDALLKTSFILGSKFNITKYRNIYKSTIAISNKEISIKDLNFGDRDDSIMLRYLDSNIHYKEYKKNITNEVLPFLEENISVIKKNNLKLVINHLERYQYGTQGHYHDDYGHFCLYFYDKPIIIDPGTFLYSKDSTRFDIAKFHNAPFSNNKKKMVNISKFEKMFIGNFKKIISNNYIKIIYSADDSSWERVFYKNSFSISDVFNFNSDSEIQLFFPFEVKQIEDNQRVKIFSSQSIFFKITCNQIFTYNISQSEYAPKYATLKEANCLTLNFKDKGNVSLNWEIYV